jgi:cytochrome bd-type quinol oxidase subunit 2
MAKRLLAILNGVLWAFLFAQNLYRYFNGWGQAWWSVLYGLIPVVGVTCAAFILWQSRTRTSRASFWILVLSLALGILYLAIAASPVSNDVQLAPRGAVQDQ